MLFVKSYRRLFEALDRVDLKHASACAKRAGYGEAYLFRNDSICE